MGNVLFIIGSHSTSRTGEYRPSRHRLMAIQFKLDASNKVDIYPVGEIYTHLIDDLQQDARFKPYRLDKAAKIPPKAIGGLSIEGLAATPDNGLLIGFRNPLSGGKIRNERLVKGNALFQFYLETALIIQSHPVMLRIVSWFDSKLFSALSRCISSASRLSKARL